MSIRGRKYIEVVCDGCDGKGQVSEIEFGTSHRVWCVCPCCDGSGHITAEIEYIEPYEAND